MKTLLRINQVSEKTGIPVPTWRHWIATKRQDVPQPAKLGGSRLVWTEEQIDNWIASEFEKANQKEPA